MVSLVFCKDRAEDWCTRAIFPPCRVSPNANRVYRKVSSTLPIQLSVHENVSFWTLTPSQVTHVNLSKRIATYFASFPPESDLWYYRLVVSDDTALRLPR